MFFVLSKIVGFVVEPLRFAALLVGLALVLRWRKRVPRLRRWLAIVGIAQVWLLSTPLAAQLLVGPLEARHDKPDRPPADAAAVIVLTGMTRPVPDGVDFTAASDRLIEGVALARRLKKAKLLFSGGRSALIGGADGRPEAEVLRRAAIDLGIAPGRVIAEPDSRNTRENAVNTAVLLSEVKGPLVLVTSARHMPRAVGCFKKVGLRVVPWPVDRIAPGLKWDALIPDLGDLAASRWAIREYLGLLGYGLAGYL